MIKTKRDIGLLDTQPLLKGSHAGRQDRTCARELIALVVTGVARDETPGCLTATLSALPILNDMFGDGERERVIRPFLRDLLECPRDAGVDQKRAYALADYAVRIIAGVRCAAIKDKKTAWAARAAAAASAEAAASASRAAAWAAEAAEAASRAAASRAAAAAAAAEAAAASAEASAAAARAWAAETRTCHARAILRIITEIRQVA